MSYLGVDFDADAKVGDATFCACLRMQLFKERLRGSASSWLVNTHKSKEITLVPEVM